jgi:predicted amidophosphoribosyltransferase
MFDLSKLPVQPQGFGRCRSCTYYETGPAALCFSCARQTIKGLEANKCRVCDRPFDAGTTKCKNPICNFPDRSFLWNYAVAMKRKSGSLEQAITAYKFSDQKYWAIIFARVLLGFLEDQVETFDWFDLIIASPTFVGPGGRSWDHTRLVLECAEMENDGSWDFDVGYAKPAIIKTKPTSSMTNKTWQHRHKIATAELRNALTVPDPTRTEGKSILVYDDVFTDGHTLDEVARCLKRQGGASEVCGVTLARQPFQGK